MRANRGLPNVVLAYGLRSEGSVPGCDPESHGPKNHDKKGRTKMKTIVSIVAFAVLFGVAPSPCSARWAVLLVSQEEAKEFGMQVRTTATGSNQVSVELEFKPEGYFKEYSRVELWIGEGDNPRVTASLREDRSKAGHVVVGFTVDRVQLDQSNLRLIVPHSGGGAKGVTYMLRVKDFVELKKDR